MIRFSEFFKKESSKTTPFPPAHEKSPEKKEKPPRIRIIKAGEMASPEKSDVSFGREIIEVTPIKIKVIKLIDSDEKVKTPPSQHTEPGQGIRFSEIMPKQPVIEPPPPEEKLPGPEAPLDNKIKVPEKTKNQKANMLYEEMFAFIRKSLQKTDPFLSLEESDFWTILDILNGMISLIISGDRALLDLTSQFSSEDAESYHSINIGIITLHIGHALGYHKLRLNELGAVAILYTIAEKNIFGSQQFAAIDKVDFQPVSTITNLKDKSEIIYLISKTINKYLGKTGAAGEIKAENILDYVKVFIVVNAYEILVHPGSNSRALPPYLAVKKMIETTPFFDRYVVKALIKKMGLYPRDSWAELNTGEIGQIVGINERFPTKPIIQIIFDAKGEKLIDTKILDLTHGDDLYIRTIVSEEKLKSIL